MDDLEVRIPKEITEYREKFYGLTLRQILACIVVCAINIPLYMYLSDLIGSDPASYVVILVATPILFIGFIKIHNLDAEKIIPYWWRNYISFSKPLIYKTEKEIAAEKEAKKHKNKKQKVVAETKAVDESVQLDGQDIVSNIDSTEKQTNQKVEQVVKKPTKAEIRQSEKLAKQQEKEAKKQEKLRQQKLLKEEKEHRKQLKAKRKAKAELEEARRKFGLIEEPKVHSSALNEEDLEVLKQLAQVLGKEKKNVIQKETEDTETDEDTTE